MTKKFKQKKWIFKLVAVASFSSLLAAGSVYGIVNQTTHTSASPFVSNQDSISLNNQDFTSESQPTVNDIYLAPTNNRFTHVSTGANQHLTDPNNNFVLSTQTHQSITTQNSSDFDTNGTLNDFNSQLSAETVPGLIKLNSFGQRIYGIDFSGYTGYTIRQVVQNYNNKNQYFVLVVNERTVNVNYANGAFTVTAGHAEVLQVMDNGTAFGVTRAYTLNGPVIDSSLTDTYKNLQFDAPWDPKIQNEPASFTPNLLGANGAATAVNLTGTWQPGAKVSPNAGTPGQNDRNSVVAGTQSGSAYSYSKNVATHLYLNNLNNMTFIRDDRTNKDAIYIFGGSDLSNLWFYAFDVDQSTNNENTIPKTPVSAKLYAQYSLPFTVPLVTASNRTLVANARSLSSTSYTDYLRENIRSFPQNASFPAYQVAGARTVTVNGTTSIKLELIVPNVNNNGATSSGSFTIRTTNYNVVTGKTDRQVNSFVSPSLDLSMSVDQAIQIAGNNSSALQSNTALATVERSFVKYSTYNVTPSNNDGWDSTQSNKYLVYDTRVGSNNFTLSFSYTRTDFTVTRSGGGQPTVSDSTTPPALDKNARFTNLTGVSYSNDSWFLTYRTQQGSATYILSYDPILNRTSLNPTNLGSANGSTFGTTDGSQIVGIVPLTNNFVYVITRNQANNQNQVNLWRQQGSTGNYVPDTAFQNAVRNGQGTSVAGVPTYANPDGTHTVDQQEIWGTVEGFKPKEYLEKAGFFQNPASQLASQSQAVLKTLVDYKPSPNRQNQDYQVIAKVVNGNDLQLEVRLQYYNGEFFNPDQIVSVNQGVTNPLVMVYSGFSAQPSWVIPVAVAIPILLAAAIVGLGLGIGIPMRKARKIQDKGFISTFKKVDTLTSAVGSVYKKIITETASVKKKPQLLKTGKKPTVPAGKPVAPVAKPTTPAAKPTAPTANPTKPVASPTKPAAPKAPTAAPKKPVAPTSPAKPTAPAKPA
ncbi:hypothetical protein [[Mycoplasma] testudinis]|uniref:hypothetical protein n=1 Tax=[Mycoplasma] testudinis TaxID=33924 RepID=UPI0004860560|nr:hypothetical protein [[Mycoplasma] testudinis]